MSKAIRIHSHGGPEVMRWEDIELAPPAAGEARLRHAAIAPNFSHVNVRRGGVCRGKGGAGGVVKRRDDISEQRAAALLLKGLTASMIVNRVWRPKPGETILVHAAASGVGLILTQWAKHLGATVIGTVGSHDKAATALAHGCAHAILYRERDFVAEVKGIVARGVDAVFDGVGRDTFEKSFDCVRPFGMLVNYGNASGHPAPLDLLLLAKKGSLAVSRPGFHHHIDDPAAFRAACAELFELVRRGVLRIEIGRTYALKDAAAAHRDVEDRRIAGSGVVLP